MRARALLLSSVSIAALAGCSSADPDGSASGGNAGAAGSFAAQGGAIQNAGSGGGSSHSGGVPWATGGSSGSSSGGASVSGGAASGGQASFGGTSFGSGGSARGGSSGLGGAPSGSGGRATGGTSASGGTAGKNNGGAGGKGGSATTGGKSATGGAAGTGDPVVHFVGRVDQRDATGARFAWSGTGVVARFDGTSVSVKLGGTQQYTVVIDGTVVKSRLVASNGTNSLASNLAAGTHTVELYRRTEASEGEAQFQGFDFGSGHLLAPPAAPTRRIEIIGDSITCGYGDEGPDQSCSYSGDTENHYLTYGAITARNLGAELSTIAWSGKGVVCNYGDDTDSCTNPLPTYYERTLPDRQDSVWDFASWQPDAVVVNLGTNDFSTDKDPSKADFESAYQKLLQKIRAKYANAYIFCTNGPMLSGTDLSNVRTYIQNVVKSLNSAGDTKIKTFDLPTQDGTGGYGCDWHPSLSTHRAIAEQLTSVLTSTLGW